MGLWEKIFGGGERERQIRSPRVSLLNGEEVYFEHADARFNVRNLSDTGLGMDRADRSLSKGAVLEGRLCLLSKEIPARLEIMWVADTTLGGRFLGDSRPIRAVLVDLFREEIQATGMSEVASERLVKEGEGSPRWFYAPGNYELFFLEKDGQVLRFDLDMNGRIFAAERGGRLRTGTIRREDRNKPSYAKSDLIQWNEKVDDADRVKAERVINNIQPLPRELAAKICEMLRS